VLDLIRDYDVIVDGAANFPTRYLLNDAAVRERKPVVHASILGFDGQLTVFVPYEGPCYRCLYPQPPPADLAPSCGANGVLGVLPGIMGLLQANEAIKLIIGKGEPLVGRLLLFEALSTQFTELKVRRDAENCPVCGDHVDLASTEFEDYEALCAAAG
jgi:sulfur-carrier protein adenylyltransferase/sulfurtransferase